MQYCKKKGGYLLLFLIVSSISNAQMNKSNEKALSTGHENSKQFVNETLTKQLNKEQEVYSKDEVKKIIEVDNTEKTKALFVHDKTNPVFNELKKGLEINPNTIEAENNKRYGDATMLILISMSMPETSISTLFLESKHQYPDKNIIFLFRGFNAPNFQTFFTKVRKLINKLDVEPEVAFDPTVFNTFEVTEVPFFAVKNQSGLWRKVLGDVSISRALEEAESHYDKFTPIGRTYLIEEQNLLAYIDEKAQNYDWDKDIATAKSKILTDKFDVAIPTSRKDSVKFIDPTVTIKKPIMKGDEVIVSPGTKVNPLEYQFLTKKYGFINANDRKQIELAKSWVKEDTNLKIITTSAPSDEIREEYVSIFGQIHELDPLLKKRFSISEVPSLVSQQELTLKVQTFAIKEDNNAK